MSITIGYTITFNDRRCGECKRFYAHEGGETYVHCPWCSRAEVLRLREQLDRAKRVERGLRAALKRSKPPRKLLPREASR